MKLRLSLFLAAWLLPLAALAHEPRPMRLTIELLPHGITQPLEGTLVLRPVGGKPESAIRVPVRGPAPIAAKIGAGVAWEILTEVNGTWAPRRELPVGTPGMEIIHRLPLWPVARAAGSVKVEKGVVLPKEVKLNIQEAGKRTTPRDVPASQVSCPVNEEASWSCVLPAAALDVAVAAEGFVPHYHWGVPFKAGEVRSFGVVELKRGASVIGMVEVENGSLAPECRVRLSPLVAPGALWDPTREKMKDQTREVQVNDRGFFQISGVPPGSYLLEAEQPGFAKARLSPLEVWERSETALRQPLLLRRPLDIEIQIVPAADWYGKPWRVRLARVLDFSVSHDPTPAYDGPADEQGQVIIRGQSPGAFTIQVDDSMGSQLYNEFAVPILQAADARQVIEIGSVSVRGRVLFGKEPLAASLWFGGRSGAVRVAMESDEEGRFAGLLPHDGVWRLQVQSADGEVKTSTKVLVDADSKGRASVTVSLPDTHLFGRVVDDQSRPVAGASVDASTGEDQQAAETDIQGRFQMRGLPAGLLQAAASNHTASGDSMSDPLQIYLLEGHPTGPVELRLRKNRALQGRVISVLGPVPGASLLVLARRPILPFGNKARTALDGSFTSQIPERAESVAVVVSAPGHALKAFEVDATGNGPVVLEVPASGGSLEIEVDRSKEETLDSARRLLVFQDGMLLSYQTLVDWARGHGTGFYSPGRSTELQVPNVAPGEYRVCSVPAEVAPVLEAVSGQGQGNCASGYLTAGNTLRLKASGSREGGE